VPLGQRRGAPRPTDIFIIFIQQSPSPCTSRISCATVLSHLCSSDCLGRSGCATLPAPTAAASPGERQPIAAPTSFCWPAERVRHAESAVALATPAVSTRTLTSTARYEFSVSAAVFDRPAAVGDAGGARWCQSYVPSSVAYRRPVVVRRPWPVVGRRLPLNCRRSSFVGVLRRTRTAGLVRHDQNVGGACRPNHGGGG
jgi:hypothetical protein